MDQQNGAQRTVDAQAAQGEAAAGRAPLGDAPFDLGAECGASTLFDQIEQEGLSARGDLAQADRHVAALTSACAREAQNRLRGLVQGALAEGLNPEEILEVFLQTALYSGFPTAERAHAVAAEVFADQGRACLWREQLVDDPDATLADGERFKAELHGVRRNRGHADPDNPSASALYRLATLYGYGVIWRRPGLSVRRRLICAVAGFASLGAQLGSVRKFSQAGLDHGLRLEELRETIMQTTPYCGFPRALEALMALQEAFEAWSAEGGDARGATAAV